MLSEAEDMCFGAKSRKRSDSGNGRMYDPLIGQFLSPDNFIQDPFNSQNLNRYTYCLNNPIKYYDISGMNFFGGNYTYNSFGTQGHQTIKEMLDQLFGAASADFKTSLSDQQSFWSLYEEAASSGGGGSDGDKYSVIMVPNPVGIGFIPVVVPAQGGGEDPLAYRIANAINEYKPIANLWDVVAYAFTGKDRFGNSMSLGQGMLKAATLLPVGKLEVWLEKLQEPSCLILVQRLLDIWQIPTELFLSKS